MDDKTNGIRKQVMHANLTNRGALPLDAWALHEQTQKG